MLFNLLDSAGNGAGTKGGFDWTMLLMFGVIIVMFIAMSYFQKRNQKKREEEAKAVLDALKPGNKVKTIGGICGTVVEVDAETFVLETGSEKSGKSYMTFDKFAIAQTDATAPKEENVKKNELEPTMDETSEEIPVFEEEISTMDPVFDEEESVEAPVETEESEE